MANFIYLKVSVITAPCLTFVPMAGEMLLTFPEPLITTFSPKFSISKLASFLFLPKTLGTKTNSGPLETTTEILLPKSIESDLSGL